MGHVALVFSRHPQTASLPAHAPTRPAGHTLAGESRLPMATITTTKLAPHAGRRWWRQGLLGCGIVSSVLYVATDLIASLRYPGYRYADYSYSELLATGSPVRG